MQFARSINEVRHDIERLADALEAFDDDRGACRHHIISSRLIGPVESGRLTQIVNSPAADPQDRNTAANVAFLLGRCLRHEISDAMAAKRIQYSLGNRGSGEDQRTVTRESMLLAVRGARGQISKSGIQRWTRDPTFPKPVTTNRPATWRFTEVQRWVNEHQGIAIEFPMTT
jgi:hypothetical protein